MIHPLTHKPETVALLKERNLKCLRPGCGCTSWWDVSVPPLTDPPIGGTMGSDE